MERIESLRGKRVALIGLGASQIDFVIGMENSKQWDEIWVINSALSVFACDRVFMMDPASRYLDTQDAGNQTDVMRRLLPTFDKPIYTCELDDRVPALVEYPLAEVMGDAKCAYFNTTVAYALGFAYWNRVAHIDLFGLDFSYAHNIHFAEAGRACVEFWISKCMENNIGIGTSPRSTLLDSNVGAAERLYGYHRLDDPLVTIPQNGEWHVFPKSKMAEMIEKHNLETVDIPKSPEPYKG